MGEKPTARTDGGLVRQPDRPDAQPIAHEQPELERHVLPGTIGVGDYHEYNHGSRWTAAASLLSDDGERYWRTSEEQLVYDVDVTEPGYYELAFEVAAADGFGGGDVGVVVDGKLDQRVPLDSTGGWYDWETVTTQLELPRGLHTIRLVVFEGGWKLRQFEFR